MEKVRPWRGSSTAQEQNGDVGVQGWSEPTAFQSDCGARSSGQLAIRR